MNTSFYIGARRVGPDAPVYMVAELSANHLGHLERAEQLVHAAAEAGADAVKLQTYTADTMTLDCESEVFRVGPGSPWSGRTLHELYEEAHTPWEWHPRLFELAAACGLGCFSAPFDTTAVDFLERLGAPAYKIASFELTDLSLLRYVAGRGKPVIVSTGMADADEIAEAVTAMRGAGASHIALLKCVSAYPAAAEEMNLRVIPYLAERYNVVAGLSDHSLGHTAAIASVALGACIIEKHLTLAREDGGPDAAFSLEPGEFAELVRVVRETEKALGEVMLGAREAEAVHRRLRRSLFAAQDIRAGELFTEANIRSIRPGAGLAPKYYSEILGKRAGRDIPRGAPLAWDMIAEA